MPAKPNSPRPETSNDDAAPAKSVRALYAAQIAKFDTSGERIDKLRSDGERWTREKTETIQTGAIDDERKIQLVATLDVKRSMLPFAIQKEDEHQRAAITAINELYSPLTIEADVHLNTVRDELVETLRGNASIFCEDANHIDEVVTHNFSRTECGRRYIELEGERPHGPFADRGSAGFFLDWFDRCVALRDDWKASALRAGKVPVASAAV